ncbi:glycosyltransferase family 32 protein [Lentinula edodes]|uniref:Glycosyltransferase family 32 protein n=1 Tax=Lentinula edodes TaxID=5353 RepID=A0A1Q3EFW1_LENED|nr:glycosyltransferase family 32 protein [Lentinula edodes]
MAIRPQSYLPLPSVSTNESSGLSWHKGWPVFAFKRSFVFGRKRRNFVLLVLFGSIILFFFTLKNTFDFERIKNNLPFTAYPPTLVYRREDLQRIWAYEITSGHYPSTRSVPQQIGLKEVLNPGLPPRQTDSEARGQVIQGTGFLRVYPEIQHGNLSIAFPPRPAPGSIADMDVVMRHCDFSNQKKYFA